MFTKNVTKNGENPTNIYIVCITNSVNGMRVNM